MYTGIHTLRNGYMNQAYEFRSIFSKTYTILCLYCVLQPERQSVRRSSVLGIV